MKRIVFLFLFFMGAAAAQPTAQGAPFKTLCELLQLPADLSPAELVLETQRLWVQSDKERWEYDQRYEPLKQQIWPLFDQMGLLQAIKPQKQHYDYALVHGSLLKSIERRISYLEELMKEGVRFDRLIFLTGARPLLDAEKAATGVNTEKEMVEWVYQRSHLPKDIPVLFIDAPMKMRAGMLRRPQTTDTIQLWLQQNPPKGSLLAVSSQPYAAYQDAVVAYFLPEGYELETVGPAVLGSPGVSIILDSIAKELFWRNSK